MAGKSMLSHWREFVSGLLSRIRSTYSPSEQSKVVVVFDAKRIPLSGQQVEEYSGGVKVLYSIDFADADEMIESLIAQHASPKQLLVVSSDHRLQKAAQKRKAQTVDSGEWYDRMDSADSASQSAGDGQPKSKSETPLLTDEELAIFKDDVNDQINRHRRSDSNWR